MADNRAIYQIHPSIGMFTAAVHSFNLFSGSESPVIDCMQTAPSSVAGWYSSRITSNDGRRHRGDWQLSVNCFSRPDSNSCLVSVPPPIHTPLMNTCGTFDTHTYTHTPDYQSFS